LSVILSETKNPSADSKQKRGTDIELADESRTCLAKETKGLTAFAKRKLAEKNHHRISFAPDPICVHHAPEPNTV
jgi:hypothetical protein